VDKDDNFIDTIAPKSDQLNADDLLAGSITVTITDVSRGSIDQPVILTIPSRQPYKPCKGMRRVFITAWGEKPQDIIGKSMTLFCEPSVKYGGKPVGGIQISHLSHIDKPHTIMLTVSRGKKIPFTVQPLIIEQQPQVDISQLKLDAETAAAGGIKSLEEWWIGLDKQSKNAMKPHLDEYKVKAGEAE
jgi:hypothetical protein